MHGRNAVDYAVAVGSLRDSSHGKLRVYAIVCLGERHALVIANHVELLRYLHVLLVGVELGIIEYVLVWWSLLALELKQGEV